VRGKEDDWKLRFGRDNLMLQIEAAHAGHADVENQACRIPRLIGAQKRLRRRKTQRPKADRSNEIVERIPKGVVIINDSYDRSTGHEASISSLRLASGKKSRASTARGESIVRGRKLLLDFG
jgi:hypothetical protein